MMNEGKSIVKYYDSFFDKNRASIVLEQMDGDLRNAAHHFRDTISEQFLKYALYKAL
jgi:hypothetical protein